MSQKSLFSFFKKQSSQENKNPADQSVPGKVHSVDQSSPIPSAEKPKKRARIICSDSDEDGVVEEKAIECKKRKDEK
uniref:Uncharacterized protein n=1 Tax=Romanomermis culicivorax TaxID=13658 RepID=A0A915HIU2_ROMCU